MHEKGVKSGVLSVSDQLGDPLVSRWIGNVRMGSPATADVYFRRLRNFCNWAGRGPLDLVKMSSMEIFELVLDFISAEIGRECAGSYVESTVKVVKNWLRYNDIVINKRIIIPGIKDRPTLREERVPSPSELGRIFRVSSLVTRVACVLMAHSGLRPQVLGNYRGLDGLRLRDILDLRIEHGEVSFARIPAQVLVRAELSKTGQQYFSFLSREGCEYLRDLLYWRMRRGQELRPDTDLICGYHYFKPFMTAINVGDRVRFAIRRAGFQWRPYVLRSYFDTQLLIAESRGAITHAYRQFFMGHMGDMEARYTTNKARLPPDLVEDMRAAYCRSQPFLQTVEMEKPEGRQKIVPVEAVEERLSKGWEFVAALPDGHLIMETPR